MRRVEMPECRDEEAREAEQLPQNGEDAQG